MQTMPVDNTIKVGSFAPERGNRYKYVLEDGCANMEQRTLLDPIAGPNDFCIGADEFKFPAIQDSYLETGKQLLGGFTWNAHGANSGLAAAPGVHGTQGNWDILAYAFGDVDNDVSATDVMADSWSISTADGTLNPQCPSTDPVNVSAGEPFIIANDVNCQ
jgi:hypothetical protein